MSAHDLLIEEPRPAARPLPGRLGPYVIRRPLGTGGMARVVLAEHTGLCRPVALKILPDEAARDPVTVERFLREARAAAALDHPNIVRAYDVGQADGFYWLVMEYVPGEDLETVRKACGRLEVAEAVGYAIQAAAGLRHAHRQGVVHRDIKPANLLLDRNGVIKILDMGLARIQTDHDDRLTEELDGGAVLCTPDYVSPEQLDPDKTVDGRADIYALGGTVFALIAGRPPFAGMVAQKLVAHQMREAPALSSVRNDVSPDLSAVVAKMLAKDPSDRFASASEVMRALAPWREPAPLAEAKETGRMRRTQMTLPSLTAPNWAEITGPLPPVQAPKPGPGLWQRLKKAVGG